MTGQLTVDGYTFDNPPDEFDKQVQLSNTAVPFFDRFTADFYQSGSQEVTFTVKGDLSLSEQSDLSELETLQQKAIEGGEVTVDFDPFFAGKGVIEDSPFRQENNRARYNFTFTVNEVQTDATGYPAHATPTTGNTFELGSFNFGYDPESLRQSYERQTTNVETLEGLNRAADNAGLVPKVEVSGQIDGAGAQALWEKARKNELSYLSAEFQNGWSLVTKLRVSHDPNTPDFVTGLYRYTVNFLIVKDPSGGIGQVSSFIDHDTRDLGTYTADSSSGAADAGSTDFGVQAGTVDLQGNTTSFDAATVDVQLGQTNYVYVADPDADQNGEVRVNQSAFPNSDGRLYTVETDDNGITNVTDERAANVTGGTNTVGAIGFTVDAGSDSDAGVSWSKTVLELTASTTNYVYADGSTGAVSFNTSGFPAGDVDLYEVQTDATSVDVVIDQRAATTTGGDDELDTIGYTVQGGTGSINDAYVQWDDTTVDLRYSRDNYVFVTDDNGDGAGQVEVNQSNVPQDALGLWKVTTDDSGITNEEDLRDSLIDDGDDSSSDLSFTENFQIKDARFRYAVALALGDEPFSINDPDPLPALGLTSLTEPVPDPQESNLLPALGVADLSDTVVVVDGGSSQGGGGGGVTTKGWVGPTDWDNAVSQNDNTIHAGYGDLDDANVQLGIPADPGTIYDASVGAHFPMHGPDLTDVSGNGNDGTFQNAPNTGVDGVFNGDAHRYVRSNNDYSTHPIGHGNVFGFGVWLYLVDGNHQGVIHGVADNWYGVNAGQPESYNGQSTNTANINIPTDTWVPYFVRYDNGGNITWNIDGEQDSINLVSRSGGTANIGRNNFSGGQNYLDARLAHLVVFTSRPSQADAERWNDPSAEDGALTTATKSFGGPSTPDLVNVSKSLNGGSCTVDVIGSPGTASEEIQPVTLTAAATSYSISWNTTHQDFRVTIRPSTADPAVSPTVAGLDLEAGSSAESDQNPQTTWEVTPGIYERSGNEYEGGGVVSRYEG